MQGHLLAKGEHLNRALERAGEERGVPATGKRMISRIQLLRNIGQFDSVNTGATIPLARLTLVYSENGRGKTTLAAVLRSLATGDPLPIAERRRLAAQHPPHVVVECSGGPPPAVFENNTWNRTLPDVVVFDDVFIDENVHSGLAVQAHHRQNLHDGMSVEESVGNANATSGMAVLFAGTTVVIAILGLFVAGLPALTSMGIAVAYSDGSPRAVLLGRLLCTRGTA